MTEMKLTNWILIILGFVSMIAVWILDDPIWIVIGLLAIIAEKLFCINDQLKKP